MRRAAAAEHRIALVGEVVFAAGQQRGHQGAVLLVRPKGGNGSAEGRAGTGAQRGNGKGSVGGQFARAGIDHAVGQIPRALIPTVRVYRRGQWRKLRLNADAAACTDEL